MSNFKKRKKTEEKMKLTRKGCDVESHLFRSTQRCFPPKTLLNTVKNVSHFLGYKKYFEISRNAFLKTL